MVDNTQIFIMACITILYFILPAYVSNGSALVFGGGLPLDFKKTDKNGNRWIGNGVTWKGLIGGTIMGTLMGAIQGLLGPMIHLYPNLYKFSRRNNSRIFTWIRCNGWGRNRKFFKKKSGNWTGKTCPNFRPD